MDRQSSKLWTGKILKLDRQSPKVGQAKVPKLDRQSSKFWTRQSSKVGRSKEGRFLGVLGAFVRKDGRGKETKEVNSYRSIHTVAVSHGLQKTLLGLGMIHTKPLVLW